MLKHKIFKAMTLKLLMSLLFFSVQLNLSAQKYSSFKAAFSLIEKNTLKDTSSLVHGDVTYELTSDQTDYYVIFPSEEIWSF
jgi:hypothetical protein